MKKKNLWIIPVVITITIFYLILIGFFFYVVINNNDTFEILEDGSVSINDGDLTISSDISGNYNDDRECYCISGYLINNTDKNYDYIDLTYTFFDKDGYTLGNDSAYLAELNGKGTWRFKVWYCDIDSFDVDHFEFNDISLY